MVTLCLLLKIFDVIVRKVRAIIYLSHLKEFERLLHVFEELLHFLEVFKVF